MPLRIDSWFIFARNDDSPLISTFDGMAKFATVDTSTPSRKLEIDAGAQGKAAVRERGAAAQASARGFGETQPVAPNEVAGKDNPGGRQLNRRVEIFVRT